MNNLLTTMLLATIFLTALGCSSTTMSGSWRSPDYSGQISKVYIVGMSRQETGRRIFEDGFGRQLAAFGVETISSYKDFPVAEETHKETIAEKVATNGCDSVLLSRVLGKRTEQVVTPGRVTSYSYGPYYSRRGYYRPTPYYRDWGSYYNRSHQMVYQPPTVTTFEVVTIESVLYDTRSGELIWSAQLETVTERSLDKMITDFIETVVEDLATQKLI